MTGLADFRHRRSYADVPGAERWTVQVVGAWVEATLERLLDPGVLPPGAVLDVGCGGQPFRSSIERHARRYVGMDAVQNSASSVDLVAALDAPAPATDERYALVLCTEVLEHVADLGAAFDNLRTLIAPGGAVVLTVPFVYPLHMEPFDFQRLTRHGLERLAEPRGLHIDEWRPLGGAVAVLGTVLESVSVLPTSPTLRARLEVRLMRLVKRALLAVIASPGFERHVHVNANLYLSNGCILRTHE